MLSNSDLMLVLDTDALIEVEKGNNKVIAQISKLRKEHPEDIAITSAVYAEFFFGLMSLSESKKEDALSSVHHYRILEFDKSSAAKFAQLRWRLEKEGESIPLFDLVTASIALVNGAIIVTMDKHYERVSGLNMLMLKP